MIQKFKEKLTELVDASSNYNNIQRAKDDIQSEIELLINMNKTNVALNKNVFIQPFKMPNYYWAWDNSLNLEMWDDIINIHVLCTLIDAAGNVEKKKILISDAGTVEIVVGDPRNNRTQTKRLFKIDCYENGRWQSFGDLDLIGIERIGKELIFTHRKVAVDYSKFECEII